MPRWAGMTSTYSASMTSPGQGQEVVKMVGAIFLTIIITGVVVAFFYEQEVRYLSRENWMFRRLLSEQAKLHQMSLDAYLWKQAVRAPEIQVTVVHRKVHYRHRFDAFQWHQVVVVLWNWMFRRLLSEQAKLHQMSLDAYIAMLREAQRHTGGQQF